MSVGESVPRVEDDRLLRGAGRFVDDIQPAGALEAAFLRSPYAHARISSLVLARALALPGVAAVLDGRAIAALVEPMVFEIGRSGITWKRSGSIGAPAILTSRPPRAG